MFMAGAALAIFCSSSIFMSVYPSQLQGLIIDSYTVLVTVSKEAVKFVEIKNEAQPYTSSIVQKFRNALSNTPTCTTRHIILQGTLTLLERYTR